MNDKPINTVVVTTPSLTETIVKKIESVIPKPSTRMVTPLVEKKIITFQHRMELIRTVANVLNIFLSFCVLLRVFKVI
jgi:hypothetical protein